LNDSLHYGLGYSQNGSYETTLFSGAVYDSYQMQIYVQIFDKDEAFTTFEIVQPLIVKPNVSYLQCIQEKLIQADTSLTVNKILNEGDYLKSVQILQSLSSLINDQSLSEQFGLILNENSTVRFPKKYGPLSNYTGVSPVSLRK